MKNIIIAKRYSKAILKNISQKDYLSLTEDIESIRDFFTNYPDYLKIVNSYLISLRKRIELAKTISEKLNFPIIWSNLFEILLSKKRFILIIEIIDALEQAILTSHNQVKVKLKIAHHFSEKTIENIKVTIRNILNKDILLDIKIEPEIIGGFVVQTDSLLIDGSIKNGLEKLKKYKFLDEKNK